MSTELKTVQEAEHGLKTFGQRRINLIWESTQALIAVMVAVATIYAAIKKIESQLLGNAFVMILAMYFVRTNHAKVGGITEPEHR